MNSASTVKTLIHGSNNFRIKSERDKYRHTGSLKKVTGLLHAPFEGSQSNYVTQTQSFYEINNNTKPQTDRNFYKRNFDEENQNLNLAQQKLYYNLKNIPKHERTNNGFPKSKDLKNAEVKVVDLLSKLNNAACSDRENFAKSNLPNLNTSQEILDTLTKTNSLHQKTMVNILEILNGYLWFHPEDYKKEIEEYPEIMEKVMVNFIANNDKKVPLAYVFKALQKTIMPIITTLNTENASLTKNMKKKEDNIKNMTFEITKFRQLMDNLDQKKQIDVQKSERKGLRDINVDIGLRFKHLKARFDAQEIDLEELKAKNDDENAKFKEIKKDKKELKFKVKELEIIINTQKGKFVELNDDFSSGKEMIDKMVVNLNTMKDKIISMKKDNDFQKESNNNLIIRNNLGLEAMTPRPQYFALATEKGIVKNDENIFDYIKKPNITSSKITEYLMDKINELAKGSKRLTSDDHSDEDSMMSRFHGKNSAKNSKKNIKTKKGKNKANITNKSRRDSVAISSSEIQNNPNKMEIKFTEPDANAYENLEEIKDIDNIIKTGNELKDNLEVMISK